MRTVTSSKVCRSIVVLLVWLVGAAGLEAQTTNPAPYCAPTYTASNATDFISNVTLGTLTNTTGANAAQYTYFNNLTAPVLNGGMNYTLGVTLQAAPRTQTSVAYIDWNADGDFNDAGEQIGQATGSAPFTSQVTFTVPTTAVSGLTRLRVVNQFSTFPAGPCSQNGFGETEDYNVNVVTTFTIATPTVIPGAREGNPYALQLMALGGGASVSWALGDANPFAGWLNISPTGLLNGTPPTKQGLAGQQASVTVTASSGGSNANLLITFPIGGLGEFQWTDPFATTTLDPAYEVTVGDRGVVEVRDVNATNGNAVFLMSQNIADTTGVFANNPATAANPNSWETGDAAKFVSKLALPLDATGVGEVDISFDYALINGSTSNWYANFVVEVSETDGQTWTRLAGPTANTSGLYTGAASVTTATFTSEAMSYTLNTQVSTLWIRFRAFCRFGVGNTSFIASAAVIDNISFRVPLTITNNALLPDAAATAPYEQEISTTGGVQPVSEWAILSHSWPAQNPADPLATLGLQMTFIAGRWFLVAGVNDIPLSKKGTHTFEMELKDSGAGANRGTDSKVFTLTIVDPPPPPRIVNQPILPAGGIGLNYLFTMSVNGGVPPYTWTLLDASDASGVMLTDWTIGASNGQLTGMLPATMVPGEFLEVTVEVLDATGFTHSGMFSIEGSTPLTIPNSDMAADPDSGLLVPRVIATPAEEARTYRFAVDAAGGTPPFSWSFAGGDMPDGLAVDPVRGEIFGTPLLATAAGGINGFYVLRIEVADTGSQTQVVLVEVNVSPTGTGDFELLTATILPQSAEGVAYEVAFEATGGVPPYVFMAIPGSIPLGLSMSTSGLLTGTPEIGSAQSYNVGASVVDSTNVVIQQTFSLEVTADTFPPMILNAFLPDLRIGDFYTQVVKMADGVAPFVWTIDAAPSLPPSLSVSSAGQAATISGRPRFGEEGIFLLTLSVTDFLGNSDSRSFVIEILPFTGSLVQVDTALLVGNRLSTARVGMPYAISLPAIGGVGPYNWALAPGSSPLPTGLSLNAFGKIQGTPQLGANLPVNTNNGGRVWNLRVQVRDAAGFTDVKDVTLDVLPPVEQSPVPVGSVSTKAEGGGCALHDTSSTTALWGALMLVSLGIAARRRRRRAEVG